MQIVQKERVHGCLHQFCCKANSIVNGEHILEHCLTQNDSCCFTLRNKGILNDGQINLKRKLNHHGNAGTSMPILPNKKNIRSVTMTDGMEAFDLFQFQNIHMIGALLKEANVQSKENDLESKYARMIYFATQTFFKF